VKPGIDDEDHFDIGFEQFKLRPGLELDVHDSAGKLLEHPAQFVMAYPGRGVLVSIQVTDPDKIAMYVAEHYRISGFNGRFDFSFTSEALKVDRAQFTVLLAAPATVSIRFVRRHQRKGLALPAAVSLAGKDKPILVTVKDLSPGGAAIDSVTPLGVKGDTVNLLLQVPFEGKKESLNLVSVIRRVSESDESLMFKTGVEFVGASRNDKLLLYYYIGALEKEYNLV